MQMAHHQLSDQPNYRYPLRSDSQTLKTAKIFFAFPCEKVIIVSDANYISQLQSEDSSWKCQVLVASKI